MKLTDAQVKAAKPKDKPYKITDGKGLYLQVYKTGSKVWRYKYRFANKESLLTIGAYPDISLKLAREKHIEAKLKLNDGINPAEYKQVNKRNLLLAQDNDFQSIATEWYVKEKPHWSASHAKRQDGLLVKDICPYLGKMDVNTIKAPDILHVLNKIQARGAIETARRANQVIGQVMRFAIATGRAERDYSADLKGALQVPVTNHLAAITEPKKVGELLCMLDDYEGTATIRNALHLAPLVFVRPGELRQAEWVEINFELARWEIPAEKMKMRQPHIVPLSTQAISILKDQQLKTGHLQYVFPSPRTPRRPMSDNALLSALRRMGIPKEEMSIHGFRATARTLLDEELGCRQEFIEHQLAHSVKDTNGRAYNRTTFIKDRVVMMQEWADYLDKLREQTMNRALRQKNNETLAT